MVKANVAIKKTKEGVIGDALNGSPNRELKYDNTTGFSYNLAVVKDANDQLLSELGFTTSIELAFKGTPSEIAEMEKYFEHVKPR